jgi:hypothetical protein
MAASSHDDHKVPVIVRVNIKNTLYRRATVYNVTGELPGTDKPTKPDGRRFDS